MFKEPSFVCMYVSAYDVYIYTYISTVYYDFNTYCTSKHPHSNLKRQWKMHLYLQEKIVI